MSAFCRWPVLAVALVMVSAVSANTTNCWTNASGDGTWSNVENWSLGALPGDKDYVSICPPVRSDTLVIDIPGGVTVGAFIATNKAVYVTGETLTIIGGYRGPGWGGTNRSGTTDTWSWKTSVPVTMDCEVIFHPDDCAEVVVANVSDCPVIFNRPVTQRRVRTSGGYKRFTMGAGGTSAGISFKSTLDLACNLVLVNSGGEGVIRCYGKMTAPNLDKTSWNAGMLYLYSTENEIPAFSIAYSGFVIPGDHGAYPTNALFKLPGAMLAVSGSSATNPNDGINLNNYDQAIDRIDTAYKTGDASPEKCQANIFSHDMFHRDGTTGIYRAPTVLELDATADGKALVSVNDRVSVVWNPTNDYSMAFSNCTSTTSGDIAVRRGLVTVGGSARFANLHAIDVASNASFRVDTSASGSFAGLDRLTLGTNATLVVTDRAVSPFGAYLVCEMAKDAAIDVSIPVTLPVVSYDGVYQTNGTYSADGADGTASAAWVRGTGTVTVDASNVAVWTNLAGGAWADAANWLGGRVPTATMKKVVLPCACADNTVTLSEDAALPTRVEIRNAGSGVTTLRVTAHVTHAGGFLDLGPGGRMEVAADGFYDYSGQGTSYASSSSTPVRIFGGELLTAGGLTSFSNVTGGAALGGFSSVTGRWSVTSGRAIYHATDHAHGFVIGRYGAVRLSGTGVFETRSTAKTTGYSLLANEGGDLTASDTAVFDTTKCARDWMTHHPRGRVVFGGSSQYIQPSGDNGYMNVTFAGTNRATVVFRDSARWMRGVNEYMVNGVLRLDSDGTHSSGSYKCSVGCESESNGALYLTAGSVGVAGRGFLIGSTRTANVKSRGCRGRYSQTGGTYLLGGTDSSSWVTNYPSGLLVGYGACTVERAGRPFVGLFSFDGGTFAHEAGGVFVGAGYGKGDFVQTGGTYEYQGRNPMVVGLCGGLGRMVVSNGTFKAKKSSSPYAALYVGGAPLSAVQPSGADFVAAGYPDFRHDADGKLTVAGGAVSTQGNTYVGADGDGVLEMVGSAGSFTTGTLILSNAVAGAGTETARQTSSTVRFVLGATGVSPVKATNLVIAPGAKLEVDWTDYEGDPTRVKLFDTVSSKVTGSFAPADVTSVGSNLRMRLTVRSDGVYARLCRGFAVFVR